jgi:hypothetical protein
MRSKSSQFDETDDNSFNARTLATERVIGQTSTWALMGCAFNTGMLNAGISTFLRR